MNTQQIICIAVLAILVVGIVIYKKKTTPTEQQRLEAKEFLDKITDSLLIVIKNTITKASPNGYLSLEDFLNDVYDTIYNETWLEVERQMKEMFEDKPEYSIMVKLIDKESVDCIVSVLISDNNIEEKLSKVFEEVMKSKIESMEKEDQEAAKIAEAYENGTVVPDEDYIEEPEEKVEVKEEELPESVDYDVKNDDTVELLNTDYSDELDES